MVDEFSDDDINTDSELDVDSGLESEVNDSSLDTSDEPLLDEDLEEDIAEDEDEGLEEDTAEDEDEGLEEDTAEDEDEGLEEDTTEDEDEGLEEDTAEDEDEGLEEDTTEDEDEGLEEDTAEDEDEGLEEDTAEDEDEGIEEDVKEDEDEGLEEDTAEDEDEGLEEDTTEDEDEGLEEDTTEDEDEGLEEDTTEDEDEGLEEDTTEDEDEGLEEDATEDEDEGLEEDTTEDEDEGLEEDATEDEDEGLEEDTTEDADEGLEEDTAEDADEELEEYKMVNTDISTSNTKETKDIEQSKLSEIHKNKKTTFVDKIKQHFGLNPKVETNENQNIEDRSVEEMHNEFTNELSKKNDLSIKDSDANWVSKKQVMDHGEIEKEPDGYNGAKYGEREDDYIEKINKEYYAQEINSKDISDTNEEKIIEADKIINEKIDITNDKLNEISEDRMLEYNELNNECEELKKQVEKAMNGIEGSDFEELNRESVKNRYGQEMLKKAESIHSEVDNIENKMRRLNEKINNLKSIDNSYNIEEKEYQIEKWKNDYNKFENEKNMLINIEKNYKELGNDLLKDVKDKSTFIGVGKRDFLEMDRYLIQEQGKSVKNYGGTCGCCSVANAMNLLGENFTEKQIVEYAKANNLCESQSVRPWYKQKIKDEIYRNNGGTTWEQREKILDNFGYNCESKTNQNIYDIYNQIYNGKSVIIGLNADALGKTNSCILKDRNHCVSVKGFELDERGMPKGFWVHDTSGGLGAMGKSVYISKEQYKDISIQSELAIQYISKKNN